MNKKMWIWGVVAFVVLVSIGYYFRLKNKPETEKNKFRWISSIFEGDYI